MKASPDVRHALLRAQVDALYEAIRLDDPEAASAIFKGEALIEGKAVPSDCVLAPYEPVVGKRCDFGTQQAFRNVAPIFPMLTVGQTKITRLFGELPELSLDLEMKRSGGIVPVIGTSPDHQAVNLFDYAFRAVEQYGPLSGGRHAANVFALADPFNWRRDEYARPLLEALMASARRELSLDKDAIDRTFSDNFLKLLFDLLQSEVIDERALAMVGFSTPRGILLQPIPSRVGSISILGAICSQVTAMEVRAKRIALVVRRLLTAAGYSGMNIGGPQGLANTLAPSTGLALLHNACAARNQALVKELLAWGADPSQRSFSGYTPRDILANKYPDDELASEIGTLLAAAEANAVARQAIEAMNKPAGRREPC